MELVPGDQRQHHRCHHLVVNDDRLPVLVMPGHNPPNVHPPAPCISLVWDCGGDATSPLLATPGPGDANCFGPPTVRCNAHEEESRCCSKASTTSPRSRMTQRA